MQVIWLIIDIVIGLLVGGVVAPLTLFALPTPLRGPTALFTVGVVCVVIVSVFRRVVLGTPGMGAKR